MGYINNGATISSLSINGQDYTQRLISWEATDSTAIETGLVITSGSIALGSSTEGQGATYRRDTFKRGMQCILTLERQGGGTVRHPRGLLYVLGSAYDASTGQTLVETGCELALRSLTNQYEDLLDGVPFPLDPERSNFQSVGLGYAAAGQFLYMNNQGNLVSREFFEGDSESITASGSWVSVLGSTTVEVAPLTGSSPVPDQINLSYQVPADESALDDPVKIDTSEESSSYYITYPAALYVRVPSNGDDSIPEDSLPSTQIGDSDGRGSSCGGTAPSTSYTQSESGVNQGNLPVSNCSAGYETVEQEQTVPGKRLQTQITNYDAIGGQISTTESVTTVTSVELNTGYYADQYAYCRFTYGSDCDPSGGCELFGSETESIVERSITTYTYNEDGSVLNQIVDQYQNLLSAARPSDWRSGVVDGAPQDFREFPDTQLYRANRTITEYSKEGNVSISKTTRFESPAARGEGLSYKEGDDLAEVASRVDALNGRVYYTTRKSSSTSVDPEKPDTVAKVSTNVVDEVNEIPVFAQRYTGPSASGPYILDKKIPSPLLQETEAERNEALGKYSVYVLRSVKGDSLGLSVTEMLRDEIIDSWAPNTAFRFADTDADKIIALRMDSTSWTAGEGVAVLSTNALWMGESNGSLVAPENLTGNATPVFPPPGSGPGTPIPPPNTEVPPSIENESVVDQGSTGFTVDIYWTAASTVFPLGNDGVVGATSANEELLAPATIVCYCSGSVVESGDLISTVFNGSVPLSFAGNLMVEDATFVIVDLFE